MLRALVRFRSVVAVAAAAIMLVLSGPAGVSRAASTEPIDPEDAVARAETAIRLATERAAAEVQRTISASVNTVMTTRPATSFKVRNAIRAGQNDVNRTARNAVADLGTLVTDTIDGLLARGVPILNVSRLSDRFDTEIADAIEQLRLQGVRDLASLIYRGRRTASVRGSLVGRYELFISEPGAGRDAVKIGEVSLGDSQMVRGAISTAAVEEFFDSELGRLPRTTVLRAVRWLYRGGVFIVTSDDSQARNFVRVDQDTFTVTGVDLLPERLRIALEGVLEDSPDIRGNIDGADGFFRGLTYTFSRLPDDR